jgi:hypothetical protein
MSSLADLRPGDLGFGPIHGGAGLGVGLGQLLLSLAEPGLVLRLKPREWWRKRHVIVITEAVGADLRYPLAVQAMPGGAEEILLRPETHWTKEWTYVRPAYGVPGQGHDVADAAQAFVGTPYDFVTYPAIPLYRAGLRTEKIKDIISGTDTMMCSRLADAALEAAGWNVFDDERMRGNVTPSELYRQLLACEPEAVIRPGG